MSHTLNSYNIESELKQVTVKEYADECPLCHKKIHPKAKYAGRVKVDYLEEEVRLVFQCTNRKCQELFIGYYQEGMFEYELERKAPKNPQRRGFSEEIKEVSPSFIEIYNQALSAESHDLTQVSGIGFRKAVEFLIKDFLISESPDGEEKIRGTFLGTCISQYVEDPRVKQCAERAVWIGNDEAHYTRKWEDKDVEDLKILIRLTVNWIESARMTKKYVEDMER